MPSPPLKFSPAQRRKLADLRIAPAVVTRQYIHRKGFKTKRDYLEQVNWTHRHQSNTHGHALYHQLQATYHPHYFSNNARSLPGLPREDLFFCLMMPQGVNSPWLLNRKPFVHGN
jgi:hypothetical protein